MKFVDETNIFVKSGNGGHGCVSFRREANLPFGGPDGGDGGNGGNVTLRASGRVDTLLPLAKTQIYAAKNGEPGMGGNRSGKSGNDVIVEVPVGTVVTYTNKPGTSPKKRPAAEEAFLADLVDEGQEVLVARGGQGGKGNKSFASAINQAPREFTYGEENDEYWLHLELKLIADVGLLGFPNAGKSTLLSRMSAARPKIADYPFTTMQPQLGIVEVAPDRQLVMADIPGIVEGASEGVGLGIEFLRHIERCGFLLHMVNLCPIDGTYPLDNYHAINAELQKFSPVLAGKPQIVVGNKLDLTGAEDSLEWLREELDVPVVGISAVSGEGLKDLRRELLRMARSVSD